MAKTKYSGYNPADFARQQENIRKAKGNPNKNIHHKKNGSNYGGVDYVAKKQAERQARFERKRESIFDMSRTQGIVFAVLLALAVVGVILSNTVFKGTDTAKFLPSVAMGLPCCALAYIGFTNRNKKRTPFQTVLLFLLAACGLYALVGLLGLFGLLNV